MNHVCVLGTHTHCVWAAAAHTCALPACASMPHSAGSPMSLQLVYTLSPYACEAHLVQRGAQCLQPAGIQVVAAVQLKAVCGAPHLVPHWRYVRKSPPRGLRDVITPPVPGKTAECCISVTWCPGRESVVRATWACSTPKQLEKQALQAAAPPRSVQVQVCTYVLYYVIRCSEEWVVRSSAHQGVT